MKSCSGIQLCQAIIIASMALVGQAYGAEYHLGPQDELQIKVYDFRQGAGEAFEWKPFTGTFLVAADGHMSLPLVGDVIAEGKTVDELGKLIANNLQKKVGLTTAPDASIQIIKYRPFYILGVVDKPGAYPYQPNLTVLEALGLAGGLERGNSDLLLGYERDALSTRGDLRVLSEDRLAQRIRQARLDAEIAGSDQINLPDDIRVRASGDGSMSRLIKEEQLLFEARRYAIQSQSASLEQSKLISQQELTSLSQKDISLNRQSESMNKELNNISNLVAKGLTVLPRQLELEQSTAQIESNRLDVTVAMQRAKQEIAKADRDILELRNTRRSESLQEGTQIRNRLAELQQRIETDQNVIEHLEIRAPAEISSRLAGTRSPVYRVTRRSGNDFLSFTAGESDWVQPGDVIRVSPTSVSAGRDSPDKLSDVQTESFSAPKLNTRN